MLAVVMTQIYTYEALPKYPAINAVLWLYLI